jgi:hypothetical protein
VLPIKYGDWLVSYILNIPSYSLRAVTKNPMFYEPTFVEKLVESLRLAGLPE